MQQFRILIISPLFLLFYLVSCNVQEHSSTKEKSTNQQQHKLPIGQHLMFDTDIQIGEYLLEIFEDSKGQLWFGTLSKGVAYYDGQQLNYISTADGLCGNTVLSIVEDQVGNLWFGTHTGASKYDGKTFTNYTEKEGLHGMGCKFLIDSKGNLWAGTNDGAFRFNGTAFEAFDIPQPSAIAKPSYKWVVGKVWGITEDREGNIWFGRDGYGACRYDGTSFTHFTKQDGLCSNNVSSILEDRQGNLWFGSLTSYDTELNQGGGLSRYDGENFVRYPAIAGLSENDIYTLYEDKSGNTWVSAIGHGVYRYDGKQFTLFKESDRADLIERFGLQSILEDSKGRLWCGFSGGLFRFNGKAFGNITQYGPWE